MRIPLFALCLCLILLPLNAFATNITKWHSSFSLDNGLKVIVISNHRIPVVTQMLFYHVGAVDETKGESGIAHFLEHLLFKENAYLAEGEFSDIMAFFGAAENAFTSQDVTAYHQTLPRAYLPMAMQMEADRMTTMNISETAFDNEKNVVLEERKQRIESHPLEQLKVDMSAMLYAPHPYHIPVIGHTDEIKSLSKESVMAFYYCHYKPRNATLVLSGDITQEDAMLLASKTYGNIRNVEHENCTQATYKTPSISEPKRITKHDKQVTSPRWMRYYLAPSTNTGDTNTALAFSMLAFIIGDSETGRLYNNLVIDQEIATSATTYYNDLKRYDATFAFFVSPKSPSDIELIEETVNQEILRIAHEGIEAELLERVKTIFNAEAIYAREGNENLAHIFGRLASIGVDISYVEKWPELVKNVSVDDIKKAALFLSQSNQHVTGVLLANE